MLRLRAFFASRSGSTAVMFALILPVFIASAGLSVDYVRSTLVRSRLQAAVDTAVLAGAQAKVNNPSMASDVINGTFTQNWGSFDSLNPVMTFNIGAGVITATATVEMPALLMAAVGIPRITVEVGASVAYGAGNAEVALVLDTTGSMSGSKLDATKAAAKELIDRLYSAPGAADAVKVGLVPFSHYVNVGMSNRNAPWMSVQHDYSTTTNQCSWVTPVLGSSNCRTVTGTCWNDGVSYPCTWTDCDYTYGAAEWQCQDVTSTFTWRGCAGSRSYPADVTDAVHPSNKVPGVLNAWCPAELQRLTNDANAVKNQIDWLWAGGDTFVQTGVLWGWRVLSPNGPFGDGASGNTKKVMVLMTDGANIRSPNYPDHEGWDAGLANNLLIETCTNAKAAGIEIYAIAFDVTEPTIISLLGDCATGPPYFYTASTVSELASAFSSIGHSLTRIRVLQ